MRSRGPSDAAGTQHDAPAPTLLMSGLDRILARDHVRDQVKAVLDEWRHG
jgi:hypothetical protein